MPKGKHGEEKFYELVKNFLCLGDREIQIMKIISKKEMSVEEISNKTKLSRSSVQRYIKSLVGMQLVDRRAITQGKGRKYVYKLKPVSEIKKMLRSLIRSWYKEMMKVLE